MSDTVIKVENLSKQYRLGVVGTGTISHDLNRWWHKVRGKEDPYLKIGETNDRTTKGESDYAWALKDINFEVKQGEVLGIIGKNGAGKSTLLKLLSRVTTPTTGEIKTKGRIASLLEVGTGFHPELTGRDNIFLNGAILGMTKAEIRSKFDEIVDFSGTERYIDTPVKRYSSGMRVRLAFAVAAYLEPEILIVDEVLAVGDAEFQKKAIGKMQDVSKGEGRTVLFVSHNMQAVSTLTTRGLYLKNGIVDFAGDTSEVINYYLSDNIRLQPIYKDHSKSKVPKVTLFEIKTSEPNNVQINGKSLKIKVEIFAPFAIDGAVFSFQIIDNYERPVIHQWVIDSEISFCRKPGYHVLECEIDKLRLYMGRYSFVLHLSEREGGKKFQTIKGICPFNVVMFGKPRGYNWKPDACVYLEDSNWKIK